MRAVLDASALLAALLREPGWERAGAAILAVSQIASVNFSEVAARYARQGASPAVIRGLHRRVPLVIVPVDTDLAVEAALMIPHTRSAGLSLGDRICLALAKRESLPALTADRAWASVAGGVGVDVELIR